MITGRFAALAIGIGIGACGVDVGVGVGVDVDVDVDASGDADAAGDADVAGADVAGADVAGADVAGADAAGADAAGAETDGALVETDAATVATVDSLSETVDDAIVDVAGGEVEAPPEEAPLVGFTTTGARVLYFLNNPEQLVVGDLGDADLGDKTLYRVSASGACRSFFEHLNHSGRTLGFGVQVYNPGPGARTITVRGVGFVASIQGGAPFADALAGTGASTPVELAPGASTWILRRDEAVADGSFFSGVIDYDVDGGAVVVNHTAYDRFAGLDGSTTELGYVQRTEPDGTHEARLYKGRATASEAVLEPLAWRVDDATPAGPLPVRVSRWDLTLGAFGAPRAATTWTTHIGPAQNGDATTSDMVAFELAGWGVFDPLAVSDGAGRHPNLGNWGVVYRLAASVTNDGTRARTAALRLRASPGAGAALATHAGDGAWAAHRLEASGPLVLASRDVAPGETAVLEARWVLGGPSGGAIRHEVALGP